MAIYPTTGRPGEGMSSFRPLTTQGARGLRLAAPARVLSWVGNLFPSSGEAGQGSLVGVEPIETNRVGLNPQGQSPVHEVKAPTRLNPGGVVVRSQQGTRTRVFKLDNHFAWMAIALHLSQTGEGRAAPRAELATHEGAKRGPGAMTPLSNTGINEVRGCDERG